MKIGGELSYESEKLIAKFSKKDISIITGIDLKDIPDGKEKERIVKTRVNQSFFRQTILSAYNSTCCITGIKIPQLLIASHIVPWSKNKKSRLNPKNGLCLNTLHDKAFDCGLITITPDFKIKVSNTVINKNNSELEKKWIISFHDKKIITPERFVPDREFLKYHNEHIFKHD